MIETTHGLRLMVREMTGEDLPYVMRSALSDIRDCVGHVDGGPRDLRAQIFTSLQEAHTAVVAVSEGDDYLILACAWGDPRVPAIDYLQVRPGFRRQGVAVALAAAFNVVPDSPALVRWPTWDLTRTSATERFPTGLINNPRWRLTLG